MGRGGVVPKTEVDPHPIRITEVAGAFYYCPRSSWFHRTLEMRFPASPVMMRGTVLHGFYEIMERDMLALTQRHGEISTPEIIKALKDHLLKKGVEEILPDMTRDGGDPLMAQMFIVTLIDEVALMYVTTYNHTLYHNPSRATGKDILVREERKKTEYRGHTVTGKPDWFQCTDDGEGFIIDYKTGHPKKPDMYQAIQAGGYAWLMKKAIDVNVYMHVVFWQGYHKFACVRPKVEMFQQRLDEYIDIIENKDPPPFCKVPSCNWCSKHIKALCKARR